jgi:RimJ/RimL family protein N-acetyltransferase|tara:strand:+ start:10224 stop:10796 length:573 start_codon:yes stop_codon:yes gene_type:complete
MSYIALKNSVFTKDKYKIVPIRVQDMESIRIWRNNQMDVLRQKKEISFKNQINYFNNTIKPLFKSVHPEQLLFSFLKNSQLIGYGGLVHISWADKRAEISFLVDSKRSEKNTIYCEDFQIFIELMKELCFDEMKFNRLFTETYAFRTFHISILERAGLIKEGRLRQHIYEKNKYYDSIYHSILKEEHNEK